MSDIRVAVVGCGNIGTVHLGSWREAPGAEVTIACDTDSNAATRAAKEFHAEAHTDWKAMIDGAKVDIVDVCTPPNMHAAVAIRALEHGLNVLCEKPLGRTPEDARAMVDAAERSGKKLMTAFCHRFHPTIVFAKHLIDNDDLGRVVMFRNRFGGYLKGVENLWFGDPEIAGGGSLIDTAVHSIDLFRFLVGEVKRASGCVAAYNPKMRVEDSSALVLESEDGAIGVIESSWATPDCLNVVEIYGTAGACIVDYDNNNVRYKTADMAVWQTREIEGDRFVAEVEHFADAVRGVKPQAVTGFDGLRANEVIAQVYASAK